jgi:hypothetical protein
MSTSPQTPGSPPVADRRGPFGPAARAAARALRRAHLLAQAWRQTQIDADELDPSRCHVGPSLVALINREGKIAALFTVAKDGLRRTR